MSKAEKGIATRKVTVTSIGPPTVRAKLGDRAEVRLLVKNMSNQDVRLEKAFLVPRKPEFSITTGGAAVGRQKPGGEPPPLAQPSTLS